MLKEQSIAWPQNATTLKEVRLHDCRKGLKKYGQVFKCRKKSYRSKGLERDLCKSGISGKQPRSNLKAKVTLDYGDLSVLEWNLTY